jgi:3-oxoacyl-[acyl-carrier protein] reductase
MTGQVVVIIGGASGIGLATARRYAADGAVVVIADLDADLASQRVAELGGPAWSRAVEVTNEDTLADLFDEVVTRSGRPDVVVNCAGIGALGILAELEAVTWRRVLDVCLTGGFLTIKQAAKRMTDGGSIVTIASLNARQPAAGMGAYCAAKAGVAMLTEVAALELGPRGIRVNAISPGLVDTPLVAPLFSIPGVESEFLDNTPLGRCGTPDDIGVAVQFLCTPGSWITGETLNVNGGAHTRRYPDLPGAIAAAQQK